jgi:hypothetical protein
MPLFWRATGCSAVIIIKQSDKRIYHSEQARFLQGLLRARNISARQIARRTAVIAEALGRPELAVGHQSVAEWVKGAYSPNREHRAMLTGILRVPLPELNAACDADLDPIITASTVREVRIYVEGRYQTSNYNLVLKNHMDISRPALHRRWTDIFAVWPKSLERRFHYSENTVFGWIPDHSASPIVTRWPAMVPVFPPPRDVLQLLGTAGTSDRYLWFVYLPGGTLDIGVGYREGRTLSLIKNNNGGLDVRHYPLSRVELAGYFTGSILFHVDASDINGSSQVHAEEEETPSREADRSAGQK